MQGYPTLKLWKDCRGAFLVPSSGLLGQDGRMQDYNGGRDFNSMKREAAHVAIFLLDGRGRLALAGLAQSFLPSPCPTRLQNLI